MEDAAAGFKKVFDGATDRGAEVQEVLDMFPVYKDAAYEALTANGEKQVSQERLIEEMLNGIPAAESAADGTQTYADAAEDAATASEDATEKVDAFYDALVAVGVIALSERDALRGLEESFDAAAEAATENGKTLDRNTEAGRANEAALDAIAERTLGVVAAQGEIDRSAGELAATMERGREEFVKQAIAMGMGRKEAEALAGEINLIPQHTFMEFESNADGVAQRISELHDWIQTTPDKKITLTDTSPEVVAALEELGYIIKELPDGKIEVSETGTDSTGKKIDAVAGKKRTADIDARAITDAAEWALNQAARDRTSRITQSIVTNYSSTGARDAERANYGQARYWTGGYTGRCGKHEYAGDAHKGEFVIKQESTNKLIQSIGMSGLDHLNRTGELPTGGFAAAQSAPALSVPPSREITRHAAQPAGQSFTAEDMRAAAREGAREGVTAYQPVVNIDGRKFYGTMREVTGRFERR